ncbi:hypothetical protein OV203_46315 [Nannocystis sp. ILAH1]|uniref:hypothetical protein n=1 Tax=Nannocystis sp. ILAH1 TaxID=2996789 RepID=UPI00226EA7EB|nr:hypothetical protein [Nannocystis sp. ILAH1]MCY0994628.1 hypothetical protein [Nannocystis sp. ILAH1]
MTEPRDDLPALDPRAAALLATYRRSRAMPPAARARVHDRLSGTCPQAHVLPLMSKRHHGTAWAVALALAAAVLLWLARRGPDLAEKTGDAATMSPAHAAPAAPSGASLLTPPPAGPHSEPALTPPAAPAPEVEAVRPRLKPADRRESSTPTREPAALDHPSHAAADLDDAAPAQPATDLRGEQELLARGWQSLAGGDAGAAARDAGEHARRWPAGVLAPERRALEAAASCVDDPSRGAELARAFLADHPRSPLARRVRDVCHLAP